MKQVLMAQVSQVRELLERHCNVIEIASRLHLDYDDVAMIIEFIKNIST